MSTSIWRQHVAFAPASIAAEEPFDTLLALTLANNALHLADSAGQVRVAYHGRTGEALTGATPTSTTLFEHVARFGPLPLMLRSDGMPYPMRVILAGRSGQAGATSTFRAVLSAAHAVRAELSAVGANVGVFTTTSVTTAWLTPALLTLTVEQTSDAQQVLLARDAVGGVQTTVSAIMCVLDVWVRTSTTASTPSLTGVYAAEYIGL